MQDRARINHVLGRLGLGQLEHAAGLMPQLGYLVQDHDHFGQLLVGCEPQLRTAMYEALRPHLRFAAYPLENYLIEARRLAEAKQLPVLDKEGNLRPYTPPEVRAGQAALDEAVAKGHLTLECRKCTRVEIFPGLNRSEAIKAARDAGWTYNELTGDGREICPKCPAFRVN